MLIGNSKRILLVSLSFLLILAVGAAGYFVYDKFKSDDSTSDNENQEVVELRGINLRTVDEIEEIQDPERKFHIYMITAGDAEYQGMYEEAIEYYKEASKIEGLDSNYKNNNLLKAYYLAKQIEDDDSVKFFEETIGQDAISENEAVQDDIKELNGIE